MSVIEQRRTEPREQVLRARGAFTVGEVYRVDERRFEYTREPQGCYMVGPATNYLARLIEAARPGQILVGDFRRRRSKEDNSLLGPQELLDEALEMLKVDLPSSLQAGTTWDFEPPTPLRVVDKHGHTYYCYNLKARIGNCVDGKEFVQPVGLDLESAPIISSLNFKP